MCIMFGLCLCIYIHASICLPVFVKHVDVTSLLHIVKHVDVTSLLHIVKHVDVTSLLHT